jgi:hypothetical protein
VNITDSNVAMPTGNARKLDACWQRRASLWQAAEEDYRAGMYRGAVNRIINCRQLEDLAIMLKMIGVKQKPEPLCDDVDLKRWHDLVDGKPHP